MRKFTSFLFSRLVVTIIAITIQCSMILGILFSFTIGFETINTFFILLSLAMFFFIMNKYESPSFKLPWLVIIGLFPILGGVIYILFGHVYFSKKQLRISKKINEEIDQIKYEDKTIVFSDKILKSQSLYIENSTKLIPYQNTTAKFLSVGEIYHASLLEDLKNAKHFIFMEYFIIDQGYMLDSILDVLKQKAKEGLDVRLMYDDLGTIRLLPNNFYKTIQSYGIKCIVFNRFTPSVSLLHNNRDHRKITVIDGYIGYTGGINIGDEYINAINKFGHWKDSGIRLYGEAVRSLTIMFLELWKFTCESNDDFNDFYPRKYHKQEFESDGIFQPYGDTPLDHEHVGEYVYLNMINQATDYIYINSPYLIVDFNLMEALRSAAKRGVDVNICTPGNADKWYVHIITQSHYEPLISAGVKIYEYTNGFMHSKTFICDDKVAVVGTINLDYRSLIHHFECGCWIANSSCIKDIKTDYLETLKTCELQTLKKLSKVTMFKRLIRSIIRFFSPLL